MTESPTVWRDPPAETHDYPGLCVSDNRVSGSITVGCSRLPLWAFTAEAITGTWEHVVHNYPGARDLGAEGLATFLGCLLEQRGEFARLLVILADAELRSVDNLWRNTLWWDRPRQRKRVAAQLRRCLDVLGEGVA